MRPRVLVIDDELLLGQTLQLGLEETFDVELESKGRRGLERLLGDETFDLVFCDLSLPDLHGSEIYRAVAEARPELLPRFVIMTGGAVTQDALRFVDAYQGPLLDKPFTLSDVEKLAQRLLG